MPSVHKERPGVAKFERQMRGAAAEINAVLETPGWINERDFHGSPAVSSGRDAVAGTAGASSFIQR